MSMEEDNDMIIDDEADIVPSSSVVASAPRSYNYNNNNGGSMIRNSLDGVWILDKSRDNWSMRGYLETLHVTELAIQAHEKGELEHETFHTITIDNVNNRIKIVKRSRVNNDLVVELTLGQELVEYLQPGQRPKKSLATSDQNDPKQQLRIQSSLLTMNGMAHVTDTKRLIQEADRTVLVQDLTIINEQTGASKLTTRYFIPYNGSMDLD